MTTATVMRWHIRKFAHPRGRSSLLASSQQQSVKSQRSKPSQKGEQSSQDIPHKKTLYHRRGIANRFRSRRGKATTMPRKVVVYKYQPQPEPKPKEESKKHVRFNLTPKTISERSSKKPQRYSQSDVRRSSSTLERPSTTHERQSTKNERSSKTSRTAEPILVAAGLASLAQARETKKEPSSRRKTERSPRKKATPASPPRSWSRLPPPAPKTPQRRIDPPLRHHNEQPARRVKYPAWYSTPNMSQGEVFREYGEAKVYRRTIFGWYR